jgi:NAD(P)-dependent dehydrogenase (short-subunit alcohol dehydrogenase family)
VPKELAGQRLLVLGASSGIGAAIARRAAAAGARVAVSARRSGHLEDLALPDGLVLTADVRDETAVRRVVDDAATAFGGLDAIVYATAVSPLLPMADATAGDWSDVLATNLVGAALASAAGAPHLLASGGRLVLLSSKAAGQPFADLGLYSTSKAALDGLARCLPVEFPGLLVTRVVVGNTHSTDFASSWDATALGAAMERWIAAGVLGSGYTLHPDDVAHAVLNVLSSTAHIETLAVLEHPATVAGAPGSAE